MFIRLLSVCTIVSLGESFSFNSIGPIKFVSLNKQSFEARPIIININVHETLFYPFCVPNKVKSMNVKVI